MPIAAVDGNVLRTAGYHRANVRMDRRDDKRCRFDRAHYRYQRDVPLGFSRRHGDPDMLVAADLGRHGVSQSSEHRGQ